MQRLTALPESARPHGVCTAVVAVVLPHKLCLAGQSSWLLLSAQRISPDLSSSAAPALVQPQPGFTRGSVSGWLFEIICRTLCWLSCTSTSGRNSLLNGCSLQTHHRLVATGTQRPPATMWQPPASSCSSTASLQPAMEPQRCRSRGCRPQLQCLPPLESRLGSLHHCKLHHCSTRAANLAVIQCTQLIVAGSDLQQQMLTALLSFKGGPACWQKHQLPRLALSRQACPHLPPT